jgi:hypothetical protein
MPFYRSAIAKASQILFPYLLATDESGAPPLSQDAQPASDEGRFSDTCLQPALGASF